MPSTSLHPPVTIAESQQNSLISRWVEENIFVGLNPVFLVNSNRVFKRARIHPPQKKNMEVSGWWFRWWFFPNKNYFLVPCILPKKQHGCWLISVSIRGKFFEQKSPHVMGMLLTASGCHLSVGIYRSKETIHWDVLMVLFARIGSKCIYDIWHTIPRSRWI